ncbi:MAG: hydrogenase formation protein HypD [Deltaproteobacteria bacterium]|nr:hydrogenase formation protein HypD [Deltaproteobacteria bacterium]
MSGARPLELRDVERGRKLRERLARAVERAGREITVMHVCGSHEQAMARYGLRQSLPRALRVQMGPGCPVCVTDAPEIDAVITLAEAGHLVLTYGDMLRVPGRAGSLDDARAAGARVEVIYSATQALERARATRDPVIFFATGFETTAVATAAILLQAPPDNLFVYSAHKWVPAAMEVVACSPGSRIEGYLAAGHAATITGYGVFEPFVAAHQRPVVVAGFEPLDILAGLVSLVDLVARGEPRVVNAFPRCVSREGNRRALDALRRVFRAGDGEWRGIACVPGGELQLRDAYAAWDAMRRFEDLLERAPERAERVDARDCRCGAIMTGLAEPTDCAHFGVACRPESPIGACMVSSEGPCRIWLEHRVAPPRPAAHEGDAP